MGHPARPGRLQDWARIRRSARAGRFRGALPRAGGVQGHVASAPEPAARVPVLDQKRKAAQGDRRVQAVLHDGIPVRALGVQWGYRGPEYMPGVNGFRFAKLFERPCPLPYDGDFDRV